MRISKIAAHLMGIPGPDGKPDPGYEWLKKLDANTKEYAANTTLLWQKLGRQEAVLTLWNMPDIVLQKTQYQFPFDYIIPKSGTPVLTDAIAIGSVLQQHFRCSALAAMARAPQCVGELLR